MERTPAVARIIDALSPTLSAEIDRLLNETRQTLAAEFESKLQTAVREAEGVVRSAAETERQLAVTRATETVRQQVGESIQAQFGRKLEETATRLKVTQEGEFQRAQGEWNSERLRLEKQIEELRVFAEAQGQLTDASSQPEILSRCLKLAETFAPSIAIYTAKADAFALWRSLGPAVFPGSLSQPDADPNSYFKPVNVQGKAVAAVCGLPPFKPEGLDYLVASMERAIELFGSKLRAVASK